MNEIEKKARKKAREKAWAVINEHRELFDSISKEFAVEIITAALLDFAKERVNEKLEEAAKIASDLNAPLRAGYTSTRLVGVYIAQAIRRLEE